MRWSEPGPVKSILGALGAESGDGQHGGRGGWSRDGVGGGAGTSDGEWGDGADFDGTFTFLLLGMVFAERCLQSLEFMLTEVRVGSRAMLPK